MKKSVIILLTFLVLILGIAAGGFIFVKTQTSPVSKEANETTERLEVPFGTSTYSVANKLKELNIIKNSKLFYYSATKPSLFKFFYSDELPSSFVLKSGTYYVKSSMTVPQLLDLLSSGQTEYVKVSIPEGLTISKIATILDENRICSKEDFINVCNNSSVSKKYNIPFNSCEGYLFPDTYFLNIGMTAESVADIMIKNFFEKIKSVPNLNSKSAGDLNDIVILASIVEREYQVESEAPLIASVFKNRIRGNIGLYSCATVEYIITEIQGRPHPGRILIEDTKIDNPYNTYKWAGLTPGPISNPGLVALNAATNTPKTNYYFFQVADSSSGKHVFTSTFEEHKENH